MMKMSKSVIAIIVLLVLLVAAVGYIGYGYYKGSQAMVFQQGGQAGYQQAVYDMMQQAATCNSVPVHLGNVSMELVSVECLQRAQQQQAAQQQIAPQAVKPQATTTTKPSIDTETP
jgi:hypothetical protein